MQFAREAANMANAQIEMCSACGRTIQAGEETRLHEDRTVCVACKRRLSGAPAVAQAGNYRPPLGPHRRSAGKTHQAIGAAVAIAGTIALIIGFKMFDISASDNTVAHLLGRGGAIVALVGMLWFALGRIMA
jgi:hypothetical protein